MTTPPPADAVRAAIVGLRHNTDEGAAAIAIRVAADTLLPLPAADDRSPQADRDRLLRLQFLALADELAGNPPPAASWEALAEAREESQAAAIEPTPPATAPGELVQWLEDHAKHLQRMKAIGVLPVGELAPMLVDAAALLRQQESKLATTREALR